ncbi:ATP phosphoribosyltransferase regulatory subunit [Jannaschia ovalis]|uniref:Histidine--tRNA ligase n=1 Tax=Jannaschia ovalis TaxID=3038773 RepID=A0ABY8L866_9RHOB|nr:ATP phosphoribosyltransferase regulatory subunit [Jannaschia sp. GRR-S6-38]WGH77561.1 ATP phosphoribosyltransferase regulatory subunit [Jannaschia sp. GRR-S6-38]
MIDAAARARAADLLARFRAAGARPVETAILQPAGTLLELYGEDIRARAFTTTDPLAGEMMLRPDFTVPVAQAHMSGGAAPARYAYAGEVFRRQEDDDGRPREYLQVGFEIFDGADAAAADAEVFALFAEVLAPWAPIAATGDLGLLTAAVDGLTTSERRRAALRRHIWRPARFRRLMERFGGAVPAPERAALLARLERATPEALIAEAGTAVGKRGPDEIAARLVALQEDAGLPPVSAIEAQAIDALLDLDAPMAAAVERVRDLAVDLPALGPACDRLAARAEALAARGVDVDALPFAPARGRTAMEYYDGFTFSFARPGAGGPAIASGGRYDALTARLGDGRAVPAVGGVIRPGLLEDAP